MNKSADTALGMRKQSDEDDDDARNQAYFYQKQNPYFKSDEILHFLNAMSEAHSFGDDPVKVLTSIQCQVGGLAMVGHTVYGMVPPPQKKNQKS